MTDELRVFMDFYDATCDDAYRLACCYTGDPARAADAVVRTYVRAYRSGRDPWQGGRAWLLVMLRQELEEFSAALRVPRHPQAAAS